MKRRPRESLDIPADPFRERPRPALRESMQLLGGQFHFETDSAALLRIVRGAYANLPPHKLGAVAPRLQVRLLLVGGRLGPGRRLRRERGKRASSEPPRVMPMAGRGILCGAMESANFMAVSAQQRSAIVAVSRDMLAFPYHVRYELLEFAVYVLAARAQRLLPLHAACVGAQGRGILLLGSSGAGKSTLALHCLLQGWDFLAEDSVLVEPQSVLATGVANYLHLRRDSLQFLPHAARTALVRKSTVIRRRSGVEKLEIDLRRPQFRLAAAPQRISAVAFLSPQSAGRRGLLTPLRKKVWLRQLEASQLYAASQPGWNRFAMQVGRLPAFELRRGRHPGEAVAALQELLEAGEQPPTADFLRRP